MRYTARITLCSILIINGIWLLLSNRFSLLVAISFLLNIFICWLLGKQIDKFIFLKKEHRRMKVHLTDYAYGLDSTLDGVGITNESGKFVYVNQSHVDMYGYSKEELLQSSWNNLYNEDTISHLIESAVPALENEGYWRGESVGLRKDGSTFPQELILSKIKGSNKVFCVVRDLTDRKMIEENMKYMALTNELTNLPNRRSILLNLDNLQNSTENVFILFLDLDRFKLTNDTLGHKVGDQLLREVANRLKSFQNEQTTVYHLGGDEFIILIHNTDKHKVGKIATSIVHKMEEHFYILGNEISITASVGVSSYPDDHIDKEELIKLADIAMYYAKLDGKNTFKFINKEIKETLDRKALLEKELINAIANKEFLLHYQPKFDLQNNKLIGAEALIRWNHPKIGTVSPMEFIPIAEETGYIIEIGNWVMKESISQAKQWQVEGRTLQVSVNVSPRQFRNGKQFIRTIQTYLDDFDFPSNLLEIEITETVMGNHEKVIPILEQLRLLGVRIAIDDFGTGYSSLSFLKNIPLNTLKIDQSFIRDLIGNQTDFALVKSIIDIGKNLKLKIVAEGIETKEQMKMLKSLNCSLGQGYYFSRPLPPEEFKNIFLQEFAKKS